MKTAEELQELVRKAEQENTNSLLKTLPTIIERSASGGATHCWVRYNRPLDYAAVREFFNGTGVDVFFVNANEITVHWGDK